MSRDCPFLFWDNDRGFFGAYGCKITDEKVEGTNLYYDFCHNYEENYRRCPNYKGKSSGGCFLTTACVEHKGLPDDCHELTTMRRFRDEWLVDQPSGREEVAEYYAVAPCIVAHINARSDAGEVWEKLYQEYIQPCVAAVDAGEFERAHGVYRTMVEDVQTLSVKEL